MSPSFMTYSRSRPKAEFELSHHGLFGARAAAFPEKIPVVQGAPETHLRSETNPPILVGMPEKMVNNSYAHEW